MWKKNRKVFKIRIVLKFGQGTNKKWESQSLWLVIPRILLSDLPEERKVHHYEKVTKLITILRNEHSSSLLKTMQDLAIKKRNGATLAERENYPLLSVVKCISYSFSHVYKQIQYRETVKGKCVWFLLHTWAHLVSSIVRRHSSKTGVRRIHTEMAVFSWARNHSKL